MTRPSWVTDDIDLSRPSASRVYDYYLGGFHNFAPDREMAEQAIAGWPDLPDIMRANRAFLRRAVEHLAATGTRQFLDLGSGIPTVGNVHEVAQAVDPQIRVTYVDMDPVAVAHSRAILEGNDHATVIRADLTDPAQVLAEVERNGLLDLTEPVALLMVSVLHFVVDEQRPAEAVAAYRDALAAGSHLVMTHATHENIDPGRTQAIKELYLRTPTPMTMRSREAVTGFFDGFEILEPGVVLMADWLPGRLADAESPERFPGWAGVGLLR